MGFGTSLASLTSPPPFAIPQPISNNSCIIPSPKMTSWKPSSWQPWALRTQQGMQTTMVTGGAFVGLYAHHRSPIAMKRIYPRMTRQLQCLAPQLAHITGGAGQPIRLLQPPIHQWNRRGVRVRGHFLEQCQASSMPLEPDEVPEAPAVDLPSAPDPEGLQELRQSSHAPWQTVRISSCQDCCADLGFRIR